MKTLSKLFALPFAFIVACGGGDDPTVDDRTATSGAGGDIEPGAGGGGMGATSSSSATTGSGGMPPTPDTTPPAIASLLPADGDVGVTDDATIVITFSEPMDKPSTQAAFQSASVGAVTFNWLDDQTMEVTPSSLSYAEGGPDVVANSYGYSLTTVATDLAGNPLPMNVDVSFTTLRDVTDLLPFTQGSYTSTGGSCYDSSNGSAIGVKGSIFTTQGVECRVLLDFDLTGIPAGAIVSEADLSCSYSGAVGNPGQLLGDVDLEHVAYNPASNILGWNAPSLSVVQDDLFKCGSMLCANTFTESVLGPLNAQLAGSQPRLQFRLRYDAVPTPLPSGSNYIVWQGPGFSHGCQADALEVGYLVP